MKTSNCTLQDCVTETRCTATNLTQECLPACLPREVKDIRMMMLIIIGIVFIIGVAGNIITIVTLLYAKIFRIWIRDRHGQEFKAKDKAVYLIVHLALTDLLYCLVGLPSYWIVYYEGYFPLEAEWCRIIAFLRNWIAYLDFLTVAMISVYLFLSTWRHEWSKCVFEKVESNLCVVVLGMWTYSFGVAAIPLFGLCGQYGYDAQLGKCHIISCDSCFKLRGVDIRPGGLCVGIGVLLPLVAILSSYGCIGYRLYKHTRDNPQAECRQTDDGDNMRTSGVFDHIFKMLILAICYVIFILPISIIEFVAVKPIVAAVVYCFYWLIYIINFVIYVLTWPTFRKAIKLLFKDLYAVLACKAFVSAPPGDVTSATKRWWDGIKNSLYSTTQNADIQNATTQNANTQNAAIQNATQESCM